MPTWTNPRSSLADLLSSPALHRPGLLLPQDLELPSTPIEGSLQCHDVRIHACERQRPLGRQRYIRGTIRDERRLKGHPDWRWYPLWRRTYERRARAGC